MNDHHEPAKTVAILALQSPVLCVSDDKWQRMAELLASRLHHPVAVVDFTKVESRDADLRSTIEWYSKQGFQRFVILPIGLEAFDLSSLISVVIWMRVEQKRLHLHVARSWTTSDWAEALLPAICDAMNNHDFRLADGGRGTSNAVLIIGPEGDSDRDIGFDSGQELASLVYHCQQRDQQFDVRYCFLARRNPDLQKAISLLDSSGIHTIVLIPWRMSSEDYGRLMRVLAELHAVELTATAMGSGTLWDRFSLDSPTTIELLEHPSWMHVALGCYLDALSNRSLERYFTQANDRPESIQVAHSLIALEERIDSLLPSEYQGRTEEISPRSMGSVAIPTSDFGKVPWDEIWTSFCDLAMAGGPPHRGRLLEAVTSDEARGNPNAYEARGGRDRTRDRNGDRFEDGSFGSFGLGWDPMR